MSSRDKRQTLTTTDAPPPLAWSGESEVNALAWFSERYGQLEQIVNCRTTSRAEDWIRREGGMLGIGRTVVRARYVLQNLPGDDEFRTQLSELEKALHLRATRHEMFSIVGAIYEGIPAAKDAPLSVIEAVTQVLAHDEDCAFSALVIWSSRLQILRSCKFTPAACEILEACKEARGRVADALRNTEALWRIRDTAQLLCDWHAAGDGSDDLGDDIPF